MAHQYGGPWSELKVAAVKYYLECYTNALSRIGMKLWYIDAFAGSGDRESERKIGGLLDGGKPIEKIIETTEGSARKALNVVPPFDQLVFIEKNHTRVNDLKNLRNEYPGRNIDVRQGDANQELLKIAISNPWTTKGKSWHRGVVFLDPFALDVEWNTLKALAKTEMFDVWYLFPIRDVTRQLAHSYSGIGSKEAKLDLVLGPEWRELYSKAPPENPSQSDMFATFDNEDLPEEELIRIKEWRDIETWFKGQLETQFAYVSDPLGSIRFAV